ncbi:UNVERIFIED_CONTAM: hypothetical protein Slati_2206800 [Sesamum latifolium]|uniref:Reverse transcriptase domain-containing protein n=1 Tax=Sesamum latifolium TaxID=2727402 RepID=A0AAW2WVP2_9LAMI
MDGLSMVASGIDRPLYSDAITKTCTRLDFARVCVMVDFHSTLPRHLVVMVVNSRICDIEYEWVPSKCLTCHSLGHSTAGCPSTKKTAKPPVAVYVQKPLPRPPQEPTKEPARPPSLNVPDVPISNNEAKTEVGYHVPSPQSSPMIHKGKEIVVFNSFNALSVLDDESSVEWGPNTSSPKKVSHDSSRQLECSRSKPPRPSNGGPGNHFWLAWDESEVDVSILLVHNQCIYCRVTAKRSHLSSLINVVYGLNEVVPRCELWQQLVCIVEDIGDEPWLVLGDFNKILDLSEVLGPSEDIILQWRISRRVLGTRVFCRPLATHCTRVHPTTIGAFIFYNYLAKAPEFIDLVKVVWTQNIYGTRMYAITRKLKAMKPIFRAQRKVKGDLADNVQKAKEFLSIVQRLLPLDRQNNLLLGIKRTARLILMKASKLELSMLQQRAKMQWLKDVLRCDVKAAVFDIEEDKAPGPDGYSAAFYKVAWPMIGDELTSAIQDFFNMGKLLKQINATLLTLIPKVAAPRTVGDYRPISYCHVLYKIITKIIVHRMQLVMQKIISPSQNAFVSGRRISNNVLLAQELFTGYNRQNFPPRCAHKVDLRKAYDTLEWDFVLAALKLFGSLPPQVDFMD